MAAIDDLIDEYLGTALSPAEMRDLAMLQVENASIQDDAVQKAVANAQGVETRNRSALEQYLMAAEQQAAAESQKALEMAQQRINAIDQNMTLLASTVGLGKEGKRKIAALEAEKQSILQAFPQLGKAPEGANTKEEENAFDIAKMLAEKDYSPETIKKLFDENDWEIWDQALRPGDLDLYQAMYDYKLGQLPEGMEDKMRFVVGGMPETSKELARNEKYKSIRPIFSKGTFGDEKKKERDEKAAAASAALKNEISKATEHAKALISSEGEVWDTLSDKEKANLKKHLNDLPAEIRDEVASAVRAMVE